MERKDLFKQIFGINSDKLEPTYYDPVTKKIVNAKEGSLIWWHEKGHMEYEQREECMNKDFTRQSMWKCAVFFGILALFVPILKYFAFSFLVANIYYAVYEESWAWRYGIKNYKKQERKKPRPEVLQYF